MVGGEKKARPWPGPAPGDHYLPGDPIPAPEALEANSDSIWDLWHRTQRAHEAGYAETAPAPRGAVGRHRPVRADGARPADAARGRRGAATVGQAADHQRRDGGGAAQQSGLPESGAVAAVVRDAAAPHRTASRPTPPLVGASWQATPSLSKRMCLREHLAWAETHESLPQVLEFLKQLPEEEWHHMGD